MSKGVQLHDPSSNMQTEIKLGSTGLEVCMNAHVVESENQRHHIEATRRDSMQQLVRRNLPTQDAVRRVAVLLSLSRNWRRVCLPRLLPTPVCAAGASVRTLWGLGSGNLHRGAYESRKRARHKRKQQQACDVRHLVSTAPAEPHL